MYHHWLPTPPYAPARPTHPTPAPYPRPEQSSRWETVHSSHGWARLNPHPPSTTAPPPPAATTQTMCPCTEHCYISCILFKKKKLTNPCISPIICTIQKKSEIHKACVRLFLCFVLDFYTWNACHLCFDLPSTVSFLITEKSCSTPVILYYTVKYIKCSLFSSFDGGSDDNNANLETCSR